jgi:cytochrome c-type biogenesis protein CcmE
MSPKKQRRLAFAIALLLAGGAGAVAVVYALGQNVQLFKSPSDLAAEPMPPGRTFRVGGLVEQGTFTKGQGLDVTFRVTDGKHSVPVHFSGVLPDLFREGQGVIAQGTQAENGTFEASEVLAKHDEKYMPPEVVDALKRSGRWQEGGMGPGT